jgi:hypothetical protein
MRFFCHFLLCRPRSGKFIYMYFLSSCLKMSLFFQHFYRIVGALPFEALHQPLFHDFEEIIHCFLTSVVSVESDIYISWGVALKMFLFVFFFKQFYYGFPKVFYFVFMLLEIYRTSYICVLILNCYYPLSFRVKLPFYFIPCVSYLLFCLIHILTSFLFYLGNIWLIFHFTNLSLTVFTVLWNLWSFVFLLFYFSIL